MFVPTVIGVAVPTFVVWSWVGPDPRFAYALVAAAMSLSSVSVISNALRLRKVTV